MVLLLGTGYGSLMAGVCLLAKQDYGVMNLCLGSLVILLSQCDREGPYRKITFQFFKLKDLRKIQAIVSAGIVFALCFALSIAVFIFAVDSA